MKYFFCLEGSVRGPYSPSELPEECGGITAGTLACTESEYAGGRPLWGPAAFYPELKYCLVLPAASREPGPSRSPALRLNILSTDDDSNMRALLWHMLSEEGHSVEFAKDGEEVFKRLAAKKYDLIILDVNMPRMNGYKVSKLLHEKLPNPPKVIIFTGRDLEQEKLQFVCSDADAILNKGVGNDKLIQTIEKLFGGKPEAAAKAPVLFTPEPPPPGKEDLDAAARGITAPALFPAPEVNAVPVGSGDSGAAVSPLAPQRPAKRGSGPGEDVLSRLLQETQAIKAGLADIRGVLGHIELEFEQLGVQLAKHSAKTLEENRCLALKLAADRRGLRSFGAVIAVLLLSLVLALRY